MPKETQLNLLLAKAFPKKGVIEMSYIRNRKKRSKKIAEQVRKFIKVSLIIAIIILLLWLLFHAFGDMQATITGLQDQINQQNLQIDNLHEQLKTSVQDNTQLKVKINGLQEYIVDQNNVIHDLQDKLNQPIVHIQPETPQIGDSAHMEAPTHSANDTSFKSLITPGATLVPILIGAFEIGRRLLNPVSAIMGGL